MLEAVGLGEDAEAVYRVAVERAAWSESDLAAAAEARGLDPGSVFRHLPQLLALGLLRPAAAPGADVRVAAPTTALRGLLLQARDQAAATQARLDRAAHSLAGLEQAYDDARDAQVEHSIERLTGMDAVRSRLEQLATNARHEALSFMTGGAQSARSLEAGRPLDEATLARGVAVRSVCLHSAAHDPTTLAYLRWLAERGGETRTVARLPLRLLVVDRTTAILPIDAGRSETGALVIRTPGVLTALVALFESVWLRAREVGGTRRSSAVDLSDTDVEVMRILATGATDEVVGRQLGVSVRSVRRLTAQLMARFGVRSRFELGLALGRLGWSPDSSPLSEGAGEG